MAYGKKGKSSKKTCAPGHSSKSMGLRKQYPGGVTKKKRSK
jgi:hypothetical protein